MPKMKKTIIHHRTKESLNRYFKLFNRYIFVGMHDYNTGLYFASQMARLVASASSSCGRVRP